jgi:rubrerythrin
MLSLEVHDMNRHAAVIWSLALAATAMNFPTVFAAGLEEGAANALRWAREGRGRLRSPARPLAGPRAAADPWNPVEEEPRRSTAVPPGFDRARWETLLRAALAKGEAKTGGHEREVWFILSHRSPDDVGQPHAADYFSVVSWRIDSGQQVPVYVSAVSERWDKDHHDNWVLDQWRWRVDLKGEMERVSHKRLVKQADNRVLEMSDYETGWPANPDALNRWGRKLGDWTARAAALGGFLRAGGQLGTIGAAAMDEPFSVETLIAKSRSLDLSGIDWAAAAAHPISEAELRILPYFIDVESYTVGYLRALLNTSAILDPEIADFLPVWAYEEGFHGRALERFLKEAGHGLDPKRPRSIQRPRRFLEGLQDLAASGVSRLFAADFPAVHMTWGAINELTTLNGYRRLAARTRNPVLAEVVRRIMRDESRHFSFYYHKAEERLARNSLKPIWRLANTSRRSKAWKLLWNWLRNRVMQGRSPLSWRV